MKPKLILSLLALAIAGCHPMTPQPPLPGRQAFTPPPVVKSPEAPVSLPPSASPPASAPLVTSREISGIHFQGVVFDSRHHHLVVADQPGGPGSRYADSQSAARSRGGFAAVNAGFFIPDGAPLGLVASSGKISGTWNTVSSLGSGVWSENRAGVLAITRRENLGRTGAMAMPELVQAGPLLVENARPVGGLEASKSSVRTFIMWDGGTRWWIGCSSPCTLATLAQALASGEPAGWAVHDALNLDGGRSSDLWISGDVNGGPVNQRALWNRPVRNFLVVVAR